MTMKMILMMLMMVVKMKALFNCFVRDVLPNTLRCFCHLSLLPGYSSLLFLSFVFGSMFGDATKRQSGVDRLGKDYILQRGSLGTWEADEQPSSSPKNLHLQMKAVYCMVYNVVCLYKVQDLCRF